MATFTVTTETDFDALASPVRTGDDTYNVNGGHLIINTDVRYCQNSSPTIGPIGNIVLNATLGGRCTIDARNVRWLAYSSGSGNVPAIGTTVTQGSVSGELLGVWSQLNTAPTAAGDPMPATGFIKFKSVTDGPFTAGALTGIGASADGADVVGWIEVVAQETRAMTIPRLGKFTTRGDWFELGTTSGSRGQIIQCPATSENTFYPGLWIETGVGTDEYEFYGSHNNIGVNASWNTSNLSTDVRSKYVEHLTWGQLRIGSDGIDDIGHLPPAGCKIRMPNIILMNTNTTVGRDVNAVPHATLGSRYDFTTTASGDLDVEFTTGCWYWATSAPYKIVFKNNAVFDAISITNCADIIDYYNVGMGIYSNSSTQALTLTANTGGATFERCWFGRGGSIGTNVYVINASYCLGMTFTDCHINFRRLRGSSSARCFYVTQSTDITVEDCTFIGGSAFYVNTSVNVVVRNSIYADVPVGETLTSNSLYLGLIYNTSTNVEVNGIEFFPGVTNVHPYAGLINISASVDVKIRNVGTPASPLNLGSANASGYICVDAGNSKNISLQRVYTINTRTGIHSSANTSSDTTLEHVWGDYDDPLVALTINCANTLIKGCRTGVAGAAATYTSVYGSIFYDIFVADDVGRVGLLFNEDTPLMAAYVNKTLGPTSGFTAQGVLTLGLNTDVVIWESPHFVLGHTGIDTGWFVSGTNHLTNHTYEWDINTGSGYSGTWRTLTTFTKTGCSFTSGTDLVNLPNTTDVVVGQYITSNQSGLPLPAARITEIVSGTQVRIDRNITTTRSSQTITFYSNPNPQGSINPATGYRLRFRISCTTSNDANALTFFFMGTTTSTSAMANQYQLDLSLVELNNVIIGSRYEIYSITNTSILATGLVSQENFTVPVNAGNGELLRVRIRKSSSPTKYLPFEAQTILSSGTASVFVAQVEDELIG